MSKRKGVREEGGGERKEWKAERKGGKRSNWIFKGIFVLLWFFFFTP